MKFQKRHIVSSFLSATQIPQDVFPDHTRISLIGQSRLFVENFRSILEYTSEQICLKTKDKTIYVVGTSLFVEYYSNSEIEITGRIDGVSFVKSQRNR